uniref:Uncharacterized protein n=4 Tax=Rhizophagus irregularis TaxID=588596 RepID=U9T9B1_RHIID
MSGKFGFEMKAGIDVVEVDGGGVKVKVRPNLDTGASVSSDGVEAKVGGVGFKVGKVTGFSTPLGNFEINFVKMFDRWQGYHVGFTSQGFKSLMNCIPSSVALNLPKAIPNPVPDVEYHGVSANDHEGNLLLRPLFKQFKNIYEIAEIPDHFLSVTVAYRDRLRDVLLENVPVQWGKKLVRYEETDEGVWVNFDDGSREFCDILVDASGVNFPVRKQKIPELQINDIGATFVVANVVVPKHLIDRLIKVNGNSLIQKTLGLNGDSTLIALRLIPIEQVQNFKNKNNSDELHYRTMIAYFYSSELDNEETEKFKVDDNNPASVVEHVKNMI